MGEKERFKISDGRFGVSVPLFRSVKRVPGVSTISSAGPALGLIPWDAASPGLQRISAMNPPRRGATGKSGTQAHFAKRLGPPVGEKARIYRSRFPET
ncbi:unnamed protein product [Lasius platythorax]|uniref:Uncharacterized protein n=1 Tax=Lasius platythorax TaxID=488582 RepID=A0AAV2P2N5_9HYME